MKSENPAPALELLFDINRLCIDVMAQLAAESAGGHPLNEKLLDVWLNTEAEGRHRAARCPFLLPDIEGVIAVEANRAPSGFFPENRAITLMRPTLMLAWHICKSSEAAAAGIWLGLSSAAVRSLRQLRLTELEGLAQSRWHCLQPRWLDRPELWIALLMSTRTACSGDFEAFKLRALRGLV